MIHRLFNVLITHKEIRLELERKELTSDLKSEREQQCLEQKPKPHVLNLTAMLSTRQVQKLAMRQNKSILNKME